MRDPNAPDPCEHYDNLGIPELCLHEARTYDYDGVCPFDGNRAMCDEQQSDHIEAYREEADHD